jgi:transposase
VYDLKADVVRVDSTTASGYVSVTEEGLFQFGHSKDHRPDLSQVKVMQSTLDPFGMPLVTQVVSGEKADDRLYVPAIQQVRQGLKKRGVLYVGDCKLLSLENRTYIVERGFARLKGRTLSLTSMFLKDDRRVTGLIRLLSIGLQVLTLLEFVVRRGLAQNQEQLAGLYAGNPKRATATPRAETLLEAFKNIYLNTVTIREQILLHSTPLSELQRKTLSLLGLSPDIYSQLATDSPKPP